MIDPETWKQEYEDEKLSTSKIAARHGVPQQMVYAALRGLGVDTSSRKAERKAPTARILELHSEGVPYQEIASKLSIKPRRAYMIIRAHRGKLPAATEPESEV